MKRESLILAICCFTLFSCGNTSPEKYFSITTLNANLLYGFAGDGMHRELESPSVKLVDEKTLATAPMKRAEVVQTKLDALESSYKDVKALKNNEEVKDMLNASLALYEFALPVYKKEYMDLAALYDNGATPDKIAALEKTISDKYETKFLELYNTLGTAGKAYAAKHNIKVIDVNPSPSH